VPLVLRRPPLLPRRQSRLESLFDE